VIRLAMLFALAGCATHTQPNALNGGPVSACVLLCITTVQQADSDGGDQAVETLKPAEVPK
jgi:hypothetical protein